jgi:hypothetical protein
MPKPSSSKMAEKQSTQKRKPAKPEMVSPKARKQLAHNAPVRRAASKARE